MRPVVRRGLVRVGIPLLILVLFRALLHLADRSRSLEAVLGLRSGDAAWHGGLAAAVVLLRVASWAALGGLVVGWPVEEVLRARSRVDHEHERDHEHE